MLLLALALALQSNPAEQGCIFESLDAVQRDNLAQRFAVDEMPTVQAIASPAAAKCATKWKWSEDRRDWQILYTAAYVAMLLEEGRLKGKYTPEQLQALFAKQSNDDQFGFTFQGSRELGTEKYHALAKRAGALMAAEKVPAALHETVGSWFIAYARFAEANENLKVSK